MVLGASTNTPPAPYSHDTYDNKLNRKALATRLLIKEVASQSPQTKLRIVFRTFAKRLHKGSAVGHNAGNQACCLVSSVSSILDS